MGTVQCTLLVNARAAEQHRWHTTGLGSIVGSCSSYAMKHMDNVTALAGEQRGCASMSCSVPAGHVQLLHYNK